MRILVLFFVLISCMSAESLPNPLYDVHFDTVIKMRDTPLKGVFSGIENLTAKYNKEEKRGVTFSTRDLKREVLEKKLSFEIFWLHLEEFLEVICHEADLDYRFDYKTYTLYFSIKEEENSGHVKLTWEINNGFYVLKNDGEHLVKIYLRNSSIDGIYAFSFYEKGYRSYWQKRTAFCQSDKVKDNYLVLAPGEEFRTMRTKDFDVSDFFLSREFERNIELVNSQPSR